MEDHPEMQAPIVEGQDHGTTVTRAVRSSLSDERIRDHFPEENIPEGGAP